MAGLRGVVELDRALSRLLKAAEPEVAIKALTAGGKVYADEARQLVHKDSGDLAESIDVGVDAVDASGTGPQVFVGPTSPDGFYGLFEEMGTEDTPAHPFMRPAFDGKTAEAEAAIADVMADEIAKRAKG